MKDNTGIPPMEDYGTSDVDDVRTLGEESRTAFDQPEDTYAGGTDGTRQADDEGEQFGEFEDTNTGTDLTKEMDSTKADVDADLNDA
ncbi:MAG TPA: hypothetical protein VLQ48_11895 [Chloroflexia bacterium]|nr:hypothetical protein [Chloroflexia bacterium]